MNFGFQFVILNFACRCGRCVIQILFRGKSMTRHHAVERVEPTFKDRQQYRTSISILCINTSHTITILPRETPSLLAGSFRHAASSDGTSYVGTIASPPNDGAPSRTCRPVDVPGVREEKIATSIGCSSGHPSPDSDRRASSQPSDAANTRRATN
jgi:hypothetical protein